MAFLRALYAWSLEQICAHAFVSFEFHPRHAIVFVHGLAHIPIARAEAM